MKKIALVFLCSIITFAVRAQVDESVAEEEFDSTEYEYEPFYPMLRLGVYYNPVFSTARVRKTNFDGVRSSRTGYTTPIWGMSVRVDFLRFALESGAGITERRIDFNTRTNSSVDRQNINISYRVTSIDVPLLIHFLPVWPDSFGMFTPFIGTSLNFRNKGSYTGNMSATTNSAGGFQGVNSAFAVKEKNIGVSFIAGVSMLRYIKRLGTFEFGLSYQADFATMPKIDASYLYQYDNTIQPDRTYAYTFKTVNQGIRFRVAYVFLNRELRGRNSYYYEEPVKDSLNIIPLNKDSLPAPVPVPAVNPATPDSSLKPERFNRIKL